MGKNEPILIRQVSNGFIVEPSYPPEMPFPYDSAKVFQSMVELLQFCSDHFDHRDAGIESDDRDTMP